MVIAQKCPPWCVGAALLWCLIAHWCFWVLTVVSYCLLMYLLLSYKLHRKPLPWKLHSLWVIQRGQPKAPVCTLSFLLHNCVLCRLNPKWHFFPNLSLWGSFIMWDGVYLEEFRGKWNLLKIRNQIKQHFLSSISSCGRGRGIHKNGKAYLKSRLPSTNQQSNNLSRLTVWIGSTAPLSVT